MRNDDYVKRSDVLQIECDLCIATCCKRDYQCIKAIRINNLPAADVEPKRKTGRWVYKYRTQVHYHKETGEDVMTGEKRTVMVYDDLSGKYPHCPYCDALAADNFMDYCPNCGVKIDKEDER